MTRPRTSRIARLALLVACLAALGALAGPAPAAKSCERQVIDDWYDNGRVDRIYKAECYRKAIKSLPTDVLDYSSAKADIERALAFAQRGKPDPGKGGVTTPPTATPTTPGPTTPEPTTPTTTVDTLPPQTTPPPDTGERTEAAPSGEDSSSVPIPLLVLGGLAVLLFAAGAAGYLARRFRGGAEPPLGT